jgi:hypothetical protein
MSSARLIGGATAVSDFYFFIGQTQVACLQKQRNNQIGRVSVPGLSAVRGGHDEDKRAIYAEWKSSNNQLGEQVVGHEEVASLKGEVSRLQ